MSAPKPYETRPDDLLIESPELPGLFWNMRTGLVCNKDGKLLTISPSAGLTNEPPSGTHIGPDGKQYWNAECQTDDTMLTNDPQAGYMAEQREPGEALDITILRATETYKIEGQRGVKYPVPLWRDIMAIINAKITSGELIHLEGADGTIRGDALEMRKRAKLYALSLIDGMSEADLVAMAKCGGELMVSKTVNVADLNDASYTELTGFMQDCECGATLAPPMNFCPGCGARIIE